VACKEGIIGWLTKKYKLGIVIDINDEKTVTVGIKTIAEDQDLARRFGDNGRAFVRANTSEAFAGTICDALEQQMKSGKDPRKAGAVLSSRKRSMLRRLLTKAKKILMLTGYRLRKTKIILSAGICRSGSTWLFNAARLLLEKSHKSVRCVWVADLSFWEMLVADAPEVLLIKLHHYDPDMTKSADKILYSIRDIRDVAASMHRFWGDMDWEDIMAVIKYHTNNIEPRYREVVDFTMRSEDMLSMPEKVLMELAGCLGVREFNRDDILDELNNMSYFSSDKVNELYNYDNMLHKGHRTDGRRGGWRDALPQRYARFIEEEFSEWFRENGYREEDE